MAAPVRQEGDSGTDHPEPLRRGPTLAEVDAAYRRKLADRARR